MGTEIRIAGLVLALGALACQQDRENRAGGLSEVRDSAGIRIVENARPAERSRLEWLVGSEPAASIGVLEGEEPYMLQQATDASRLTDGRIVVANRGSNELRVFDASGEHLASWGGRGEGPGELRDLMHVEPLPGDSIIAWGWLRSSMTVYGPDGNFARTSRLERRVSDMPMHRLVPVSSMPDGSLLASLLPLMFDTVVVEIWDSRGELRGSLGEHLARETRVLVGDTHYPRIFGWELALEPWGSLVIISPSNRYEIKAHNVDGTVARIIRMEHVPRSPAAAQVEAYIVHEVSRIPRDLVEVRAQTRRELAAVPVSDRFPAFRTVMSDAVDHLWIQEYQLPGENPAGEVWTVFNPEGHVLGFVETPNGLQIYEIGEDYILGRVEDELGVESIQLWPLERF